MARLGFRDYVSKEDVDEALRLMDKCRSSIVDEAPKEGDLKKTDVISAVFTIIKEVFEKSKKWKLKLDFLQEIVKSKGYSQENFQKCIQQYMDFQTFMLSPDTNELTIISGAT